MTTNKLCSSKLFISDGHKVELLRLMPKSAGFGVYLPHSVAEALNLSKNDHNLVCFIDDESNFTYLVLVKDSSLAEQLRPLILEKREKAETLHRKMREEIEAQQQQATETPEIAVLQDDVER